MEGTCSATRLILSRTYTSISYKSHLGQNPPLYPLGSPCIAPLLSSLSSVTLSLKPHDLGAGPCCAVVGELVVGTDPPVPAGGYGPGGG